MSSQACFIVAIFIAVASPARALEYAGTCRGSSATIVELSGLDTPHARASAQITLPDAIAHCHYTMGRAVGKNSPSTALVMACAEKFARASQSAGPIKAEANCRIETLSTSGRDWSNAYKFPILPMCGDDNNQAISLFRVLCPSYEGDVEKFD